MTNEQMWITFGLMGQCLFTGRFVVQWLSSERQKKSIIPASFWFLSIGGAVVLLIYAIHRQDIVFTIGQSSGLFIYLRNLQLIRNETRQTLAATHPETTSNEVPLRSQKAA